MTDHCPYAARVCKRSACSKEYFPRSPIQKFCSKQCSRWEELDNPRPRYAPPTRPSNSENRRASQEISLYERPITRRDCAPGGINEPDEFTIDGVQEDGTPSYEVTRRHCPWVSCRHHLALSVTPDGTLKVYGDPAQMTQTCSLDFAYEPHPLEEVGKTMNLTRERIRQLEGKGMRSLKKAVSAEEKRLRISGESD